MSPEAIRSELNALLTSVFARGGNTEEFVMRFRTPERKVEGTFGIWNFHGSSLDGRRPPPSCSCNINKRLFDSYLSLI